METVNIPIYRAKEIGLDNNYIIGFYQQYIEGFEDNVFHEINNTLIDQTTLAIHFPSWVANDEDDNDIKAFASFNKNKIGGDIVEVRDNFIGISGVLHLNENHELSIDDCRITNFDLSQMQVIGIQK